MKYLLFAVGAISLVGCATSSVPSSNYRTTDIHEPELGTVASKELGESLFNRKLVTGYEAFVLESPLGFNQMLREVSVEPQEGVILGDGSIRLQGNVCNMLNCVREPMTLTSSDDGWVLRAGILSQSFETVPGEIRTLNKSGEPNFRTEMIYNGRSGDEVRFIYREYINDLARPAFTQEVTYDLGRQSEIGFRGLRADIIEATNTEITYRITQRMEDPL